jgi:hypothetical protein
VDTAGCTDVRNKHTVLETIWLLQQTKVLLTTDSSPLHMAASGDAWIGMVSTAKRPDLITHWRHGEFGWRMKNFSKSGCWEYLKEDYGPNKPKGVDVSRVPDDVLRSWLPDPKEFAQWAVNKVRSGQ